MSLTLKDFAFRHAFLRELREFFWQEGFLETETPLVISSNTPDPNIIPLCVSGTHIKGQLHTSPEIWLKKAINLGLDKIYQISHVFRDDPKSQIHAQEFSMLEWYRSESDLTQLIVDCKKIFAIAAKAAEQTLGLDPQEHDFVNFDLPDLFLESANIDLAKIMSQVLNGQDDSLTKLLLQKGDHLAKDSSFEEAFFHVMLKYIEPNLPYDKVSVVSRWPLPLAALSQGCPDDERFCQRFELYYKGVEIANAYQECCNPNELELRFAREDRIRRSKGQPCFNLNANTIKEIALNRPTAGIALGLDRLLMIAGSKNSIKEIVFGS